MSQPIAARAHKPDYVFAIVVFVLLAFGLIMMYNINPVLSEKLLGRVDSGYYFRGQLINIGVGLAAWWLASNIYYERWRQWAPYLMAAAVLAIVMLMVPGLSFSKNGATRWLSLGPLSFQSAELLKVALVVYLAAWFEKRQENLKSFWDGLVPFIIMLAIISVAVVIFQRDLGTMMVLAFASVGMFWVAGIRLRHLWALLTAGVAAGWLAIVAFPHRMERLLTFLHPAKDATGTGYQINQALIALGSGGLLGVGLGRSIQIYGYLPESSNDSIFAVIGEEFGLVGTLLLVGLFAVLVYRGLKIARAAPDNFGRLVAAGLTLMLGFQALINIAAMLSLVPLTGIPLPFISYGGSSLVMLMFAGGILINISKHTVKEAAYADTRQRRGNGRAYNTNPGDRRRVKVAG